MAEDFPTLRISLERGVADVVIDHPPVNVLGVQFMTDVLHFLEKVRDDSAVRVIVFSSADPDFFIPHVDMTLVDDPAAFDGLAAKAPEGLNVFQAFGEAVRHQPQVTIVKLAGIARGGGAEFVAAADMAFAAIGRARLAQVEALMGITPGGGATQYLGQRLGRNRALEVVLGGDPVDAETAERYGWVNRALPADELDAFVDRLARNIAALPDGVIEAAKSAVPAVDPAEGFAREHQAWAGLIARPAAEKLIRGGLERGAHTREGELRLEELLRDLWEELEGRAGR
ncbi:enoyl-CoA hydratase/isomerase family protein [Streptomonospora sp. S1-112]|uniref:Enoyl-CoA hydratase/isomerase family protein n=1 Tax=Streptomonospora mangrovi TaxID=2883123 RepID=A0A9X3SJ07_9ACTN|nr:enoyl-CoA hydratase/isomerase family protein [Streptomonospora mangrovi]MDA0566849.1 enoyl-CoA hydratase/isomerase family protein [Streptomonospora mangrovi]